MMSIITCPKSVSSFQSLNFIQIITKLTNPPLVYVYIAASGLASVTKCIPLGLAHHLELTKSLIKDAYEYYP